MGKGCLKCGREFESKNLFNRLCIRCNRENRMLSKLMEAKPYNRDKITPVNTDAGDFERRLLKPIGSV